MMSLASRRVLARVLDLSVIVAFLLMLQPAWFDSNAHSVVVFMIGLYLYEVVFVYFVGGSIGKIVVNLRIIPEQAGAITIWTAILRSGLLSLAIFSPLIYTFTPIKFRFSLDLNKVLFWDEYLQTHVVHGRHHRD
jgi:uncharacterized RDD family membrane protein YckC